jgi:hypothetical protein
MFLSNENLDHIKMCIVIDTHKFREANLLDAVNEDFQQLKTYAHLEDFYNKYENIFSFLCSFKISIIISNYKLANTILVLKFISKIKYRLKKRKSNINNLQILT